MAQPPILIIFLEAWKAIAFWLLRQRQVAGWLWIKTQAEQKINILHDRLSLEDRPLPSIGPVHRLDIRLQI
jgi:hypothetical protein